VRGGIRFGTGSLAHLLKNRFYIGEVVYREQTHRGGHPPIIERSLFEAVQARLAENAVGRQAKLRGSPAILTGRLFDDRGNRMSPSHTNKLGVRYRYYVSHAILQQRREAVGSVGRVPAAEIEKLVLEAVRRRPSEGGSAGAVADRDLIGQRVHSVTSSREDWKSGWSRIRHRTTQLTTRLPSSPCRGRLQASSPARASFIHPRQLGPR
jgi:site-specific DNA recombinase